MDARTMAEAQGILWRGTARRARFPGVGKHGQRYGLGRWEGTDARLARVMDEILGVSGQADECGDASEGAAWYGLIRRSGTDRGGYIVEITNAGFHAADAYGDDRTLNEAWAALSAEVNDGCRDDEHDD